MSFLDKSSYTGLKSPYFLSIYLNLVEYTLEEVCFFFSNTDIDLLRKHAHTLPSSFLSLLYMLFIRD